MVSRTRGQRIEGDRAKPVFVAFLLSGLIVTLGAPPAHASDEIAHPDFDSYVRRAEARLAGQSLSTPNARAFDWTKGGRSQTGHTAIAIPASSSNPIRSDDGLIHDWVGSVFIPHTSLERVLKLARDYDHRAQYFHEVVAESRAACRVGPDRFHTVMRLKEPAAIELENDVVWEPESGQSWRTRSYSTRVREIGADHKYLLRVNSYWRFTAVDGGVLVEAEAITLSGNFNPVMRAIGSLLGKSPQKSLVRSLNQLREVALNRQIEFAELPAGLPECVAASNGRAALR